MKNLTFFFSLLLVNLAFAQNIVLNKVEKTGTNKDKFFYKINPDSVQNQYLAELEVQGFSPDDTSVFSEIYKKAKSVGANAFSYKSFDTIDGIPKKLDQNNYKLSLYEIKENDLPDSSSYIYIVSSSPKNQKIGFDGETINLIPRSFAIKKINPGQTVTISTKKFLGSSVKTRANKNEGKQFFQVSAFKINSNPYGTAGINIKSGDITKLEKSFGDFLITIYTEITE